MLVESAAVHHDRRTQLEIGSALAGLANLDPRPDRATGTWGGSTGTGSRHLRVPMRMTLIGRPASPTCPFEGMGSRSGAQAPAPDARRRTDRHSRRTGSRTWDHVLVNWYETATGRSSGSVVCSRSSRPGRGAHVPEARIPLGAEYAALYVEVDLSTARRRHRRLDRVHRRDPRCRHVVGDRRLHPPAYPGGPTCSGRLTTSRSPAKSLTKERLPDADRLSPTPPFRH